MRTILKKGFILMISLFIAGNLITVAQNPGLNMQMEDVAIL